MPPPPLRYLRVTEGPEVTWITDRTHGGVPHFSYTDITSGSIRFAPVTTETLKPFIK